MNSAGLTHMAAVAAAYGRCPGMAVYTDFTFFEHYRLVMEVTIAAGGMALRATGAKTAWKDWSMTCMAVLSSCFADSMVLVHLGARHMAILAAAVGCLQLGVA